ncbi:MAG TPA: SLBB domain-containing protein, partial [Bacteroidota bacterium]|nr:SLBB domain-containing protein [Bacteroidota bacterium]
MTNANGIRVLAPLSGILFTLLVPCGSIVHTQTKRAEPDVDMFGDRDKTSAVTVVQPRGPALESVIAPDLYHVGPSDIFSVNVWASPPLAYQLTVTPEGSLIIPTVGEVQVADLTLTSAREKILGAIHKRYLRSEVSITLVTPRPIVVSIQGQVLNPGSYVMAAYNRVDKAVEEANRLMVGQYAAEREIIREKMSRRRIIVRHRDGSREIVDIPKFLATKDERWNPYLREGDIIVVPINNFERNVIGVYGEVNSPGRIEFAEGDSVRDAIRIAYGFTPHARMDSVELTRQDSTGGIVIRKYFDARSIMEGSTPDFPMQPGDRLLVHGTIDKRGDYRVEVKGEVLFPGTYPISREHTRLSEVIRSAGGFTESASLQLAEVLRHTVATREIELERLESLRGGVPPDDSTYYYLETNLRIQKEVVNADFVKLFRGRDSTQDVVLNDLDIIDVPSRKKTVYVFGQVVNPGHIGFVPGEDIWYYVRKAGGVTDRARTGDIKLVKAKTRQWLSP